MSQKVLVDFIPLSYDRNLIMEAARTEHGTVIIRGILQRANAKNQNGRVYPKDILERESQKYMTFIQERRALGELDHPESTVVNLKNVSHNITEMHWEGDDLCGTIEILSTPSGNIVKELMKNGIRLGVSSRGVGSVVQIGENTVEVDEDFNLICFDIVSNPSTQGAFLAEGVQGALIKAKEDRVNNLVIDFFSEIGR
jgi:hypothetical protein